MKKILILISFSWILSIGCTFMNLPKLDKSKIVDTNSIINTGVRYSQIQPNGQEGSAILVLYDNGYLAFFHKTPNCDTIPLYIYGKDCYSTSIKWGTYVIEGNNIIIESVLDINCMILFPICKVGKYKYKLKIASENLLVGYDGLGNFILDTSCNKIPDINANWLVNVRAKRGICFPLGIKNCPYQCRK